MDIISSPNIDNLKTVHNMVSEKELSNAEETAPEADTNENSSANSSLNKMESLLVEDDEDDDGLGTESLRISGSEGEEDDNISPIHRKKRPTQQILESDEEDDEGKMEIDVPPSNDILLKEVNEMQESEPKLQETDNVAKKQKKFSALIDSDSEPEEDDVHKEDNRSVTSIGEGEEEERVSKKTNKKKKKKKELQNLKKKAVSPSVSSDSENEDEAVHSKPKQKSSKISNLVNSESESSKASSENEEHEEGPNQKPAANKPKKPQRASAKKAMDEMQAIQSETQRLYRETQVNIPYHKPKRHTLKEFLTRHTIVKPALNQSGKSLKMTPEELEEYAKHLEERAKEATEFFKSESEDELKEIDTNDPAEKQPDDDTPMETSAIGPKESETPPIATHSLNTEEIEQIIQEHEFISQPSNQELLDTEMFPDTEIASSSTVNEGVKEAEPKPSTSSPRPSALAELKRRLIAEKNLPLAPKLKGDANMIIDFETGDMFARKPTGVENLFQRFIKSNKNNKRKPEETTPSQELQTTLKVAVIQESNKEKEPKPGAAYMKLKENLRTLMIRKRKEEFQKKVEESKEEQDEYNKCCGLDEDDEDDEQEEDEERKARIKAKKIENDIVIDEEENEINIEEYENEDDDEEADDNHEENKINDEENEEGDEAGNEENQPQDDEDNESDSSESSEDENDDAEDGATRKHRVIKAFEDSDDEANPDLNATSTSVLFAEEKEKNPEEIEDELLDLCSGQFAETQRATVISQIPITQTPGNVTETELEDLCSGVFNGGVTQLEATQTTQTKETQVEENQKTVTRILSSDEEKEPDEEDSQTEAKKVKKLTKKKKKHVKLGFSDDEDEEDGEEKAMEESEDEIEEEEEPQTFIDYDSEENEIEVQMSKKDCVKQANAFLEKEAELSESEWGSADEDEQNLDKYDNELGDEDEFDQQKLHTELEQIHMRKVLDDDIREVKKIQEMLFDEEEADGVGRQRKFRWKNVESGFSLDDPAGGGADKDDQVDSADDEEEIKWRKMRFEREQFLLQKTEEEIHAQVSTTDLGKKLLDTMKNGLTDQHFTVEKEVLVPKEYKPSFLIKLNDLSNLRNSMLNYDKETLGKMAHAIEKSGDYERHDNEPIMKKANNAGNFVFVPLTKEEVEYRKRKAEEAKNGTEAKKRKICSNKPLLLDKLL